MPARDLECGALPLQSPVQLRVDQGQRRLAGERLQQVGDLIREMSGCMAADNQGTHDAAFAEHGDGNERTPPAFGQDAQVGIERRVAKVREPHGVAPFCRFAEEGALKSYPGMAKSVEHLLAGTAGGADAELLGVLVEL